LSKGKHFELRSTLTQNLDLINKLVLFSVWNVSRDALLNDGGQDPDFVTQASELKVGEISADSAKNSFVKPVWKLRATRIIDDLWKQNRSICP
jgi:hypothetical protein